MNNKEIQEIGCGLMSVGCLLCLVPFGILFILALLGAIVGAN